MYPPPPPPGMEMLKYQVNVTFWFWLMYPPAPSRNGKVEISGQCDILVLADVPLQPKNEMLVFGLHSTSDDQPG